MKSITTTTRVRRERKRERESEREKIKNRGKVTMRGKIRSKTTISCGGLSGTQMRESAFASFCTRDTSFFFSFFSFETVSYLGICTSLVILFVRNRVFFPYLIFVTFPVTRIDLRPYCISSFRRRHRFFFPLFY